MNRFYPMAFLGGYSCDSPIFKKKVGVRVPAATLSKLTGLVLNNPVKTSSKRNLVKRLMDCKTVRIFVYLSSRKKGVCEAHMLCACKTIKPR